MTVLADIWNVIKDSREWKTMAEAARKVPDLERRIAALESRQGNSSAKYVCDHCASPNLVRTGSIPDPIFGDLGKKQSVFRCDDCGKESGFLQE